MFKLRTFDRSVIPSCSRAVLVALLLARSAAAQSDAPPHYYDSAIGKTGAPLKAALQNIIRNHTVIPYTSTTTDTWDALKVLDEDPGNALNIVLVYSGLVDLKSNQFTGTSGTWDREHLWPQSFGIIALNGNSRAKSDLFNLRPIDTNVNSSRGNKFYDVSTAPIGSHPEAPGSTYDSDSWEPRAADKGPISRALFYMAVRYDGSDADVPDLELSDVPNASANRFGKLTSLLAWHRQFAVAAPERQRNQTIYSVYQHNRNPFIDHPDYAEMVFLGVSPGQAWRDTNFTDAELAAPAIGSDAADPEQDDVRNLLEYVFGRDPWQPDASPALVETITTQANSHTVILSYMHNRNATDAGLAFEQSSDLQTWTSVTPTLLNVIVISSEMEQATVRFPASVSAYFVRVRGVRNGQ